jgi:Zn-dependent peptidase ImmA (M78 family)/transcriptional regulator with XRE-family HTH domain
MPVNGGMLRIARQRRGFQQGEAAERLGVAQATLSRAENGIIDPSNELVDGAAVVYDFPRTFFFQPDTVYGAPVSVHPMWRKKASVTAREMDRVVADINLRLIHIRRLLEAAEIDQGAGVPRLDVEDYGDPEAIAGIVRAHWKVPQGPVANLTSLVEGAGVVVVHSSLGDSSVSGVTFAVAGMPPLIILNAEQPADRLRFTLAHELGHLVMHRFPTPTMEDEANAFAGALLMPAKDIRPYFSGRRVDFALLAALKPEWKVAMQSMLMRARSLGVVTPNQERYLWQQFSARKMRLREPPELDFATERPGAVSKLFQLHMDVLGYSLGDLEALLHMHGPELIAFHGLHNEPVRRAGPSLRLV